MLCDTEDLIILRNEAIMSARRGQCVVYNSLITQIVPSHYMSRTGEICFDYKDHQNGSDKSLRLQKVLVGEELEKAVKSKETGGK